MKNGFIRLLAQYSLNEIFWFIYSSISYRIAKMIPLGFKESREIFPQILSKGITMQRFGAINRVYWKGLTIDIRRNTSDVPVFKQIIIDEEYYPVVKLFRERGKQIRTMIDAGSNIGLTALYIHNEFPHSQIVALEPNIENNLQLVNNLNMNGLKSILPRKEGIWSTNTKLSQSIHFGDDRHWAFSLTESKNGEYQVVDMETLLTVNNIDILDFLKIDIEGAEGEIFFKSKSLDFLKNVNVVAIEIHNRQTIHMYAKILEKNEFSWFLSGELLIAYREISFL
jgi:FkbM family methyltransferase